MNYLKRFIAVVFTLCSLFLIGTTGSFVSEAAATEPIEEWDISETPGTDSVTAKLYKNKEDSTKYDIVITGEGRMADFSVYSPAPWCAEYSDTLILVSVGSEITYIGEYAFFECANLERITVLNPQAEFYAMSDTVISSYTVVCGHEISTAKSYSKLYSKYFSSICKYNNASCSVCGYVCASHTGGMASCEESAKCEICGIYYGEPAGHRYSDWIPEIRPDCVNGGMLGHYECLSCNKYFDAEYKELTQIYLSPKGHSLGEWIEGTVADCTNPGTLGHYECSSCTKKFDSSKNEIPFIWIGALGHTGGVASCVVPCICERCGERYGNINPANHNFSLSPTYNSENHWYGCPCGERKDISNHTLKTEIRKEPSIEEEGIKVTYCDCGYERAENIDKLEPSDNDSSVDSDSPKPKKSLFPVILAVVIFLIAAIAFIIVVIIVRKRFDKS